MTAIASGAKRNLATPVRKKIGTKTMQMHSVETKAGTAICWAPSRIARIRVLCMREVAVDVLDLDGGVVDQDADGQGEPAERHRVDRLAAGRTGR